MSLLIIPEPDKTEDEPMRNIKEAIHGCVEARLVHGKSLTVTTRKIELSVGCCRLVEVLS